MPPSKKSKKPRVCRICLSAKSENRVSFGVDTEWTRLYQYCFDLTVIENGPKILCGDCSKKLTEFSEFKTLALKSETLWSNVLSSEVKNDPDPTENIIVDTIDIKDEDSDHCNDAEYLYWNMDEDSKEDVIGGHPRTDEKDTKLIKKPVKDETITDPAKPKDEKEQDSYTEDRFIKQYFEVFKLKTGKFKTKYECLKCGEGFKRRDALPTHVKKCLDIDVAIEKDNPKSEKARVPPSVFYCGLCDFDSPEEEVVLKHVDGHCTKNELNCKFCDYVGRDAADIVSHRYKHMPENNYKIVCPTCNKVRMNQLTLQFHYRSMHLKKVGGWCSVCNKTFNDYKYFRNHERLHRSDNFACDYCGMKFLFRNGLILHMKELHLNIRNFVCDTCGKSFKRNNALMYHIRAHHVNNKPVPCNHCGKKFKNDYSLRMHMKMVKREKSYICDICSKGYPVLNLLQKHMFRHTGQKPFACETCGMSYKSKQYLQIHMRKHTGDFPYKCDSCEKQFISSTQLRNHSGVHTGIHRVKCLVCEKTFRERKQMLAHCQTKHESVIVKLENQGHPLVAPTIAS